MSLGEFCKISMSDFALFLDDFVVILPSINISPNYLPWLSFSDPFFERFPWESTKKTAFAMIDELVYYKS